MRFRLSPAYRANHGNGRTDYAPTRATTTAVFATSFDDETSRPKLPVEALKAVRSLGGIAGGGRTHAWLAGFGRLRIRFAHANFLTDLSTIYRQVLLAALSNLKLKKGDNVSSVS